MNCKFSSITPFADDEAYKVISHEKLGGWNKS